jgi:hypothetical protein
MAWHYGEHDPIGYKPLNTTSAIDDALAGRLGKQPATEREQLEQAIADSYREFPRKNRRAEIIIEAARKHLETLPKPEPKYRIVGVRSDGTRRHGEWHRPYQNACDAAANWMQSGRYSSVAVEQVS